MKGILSILFLETLLSFTSTFSLDIRDQTCPDGGICLDVDGNVCCNGGPQGGCMFSTGVCCQNGYFCYEGQFCSTTNPLADDSSGLDTNCCQDEACNTVIGLAPLIIPYSEQPFYSSASGSGGVMTTSTGSASLPTGSSEASTSGSTAQGQTTSSKGGTPTTTAPSVSAASPSASKTSGAGTFKKENLLRDICVLLGLGSLILLF